MIPSDATHKIDHRIHEDDRPIYFRKVKGGWNRWDYYHNCWMAFDRPPHLWKSVSKYITGNPEYMPMSERTDFGNFEILHPFLLTTKDDMLKYIRQNGADRFVAEDPTNKQNCYRRNSIRNQIIPLINQWTNLETIVKRKFYSK